MRNRVRTAVATLTVLVGVAACSSGRDDSNGAAGAPGGAAATDAGAAGTGGGTSAGTIGTPAGTSGAAGATSTTGATTGATTGTTAGTGAGGTMTHADSLRADSIRRAGSRP